MNPDDTRSPRSRLAPQTRYQTDPQFAALVRMFEALIWRGDFTPSEVREAAMLATVNYELRRGFGPMSVTVDEGGEVVIDSGLGRAQVRLGETPLSEERRDEERRRIAEGIARSGIPFQPR